ncbi:MAG: glycosyltransferase family 2 protein [Bacteroidaceae bacterium]|nr:glycosyltransferase family 2 protein [Bacteroidaceae bacterium]
MTTKPFLSIIIPVYNGLSNGLLKCLDSIWEQSLSKQIYEVICIDDCSIDGTRSWLKEQQKEHSNLVVIENEKNIRQGGARNKGVRVARGKYICFIDQDDYYHKESITQVYNHLSKNDLEILIVDCAYQSPEKESNTLQHNFPHKEIMTGDEQIERNSIPYAPWKFIFLRTLMVDNNLFFAENERIEDVDWVHRLTHYATRTQYQPILLIHYNKSSISTTMTAFSSKEIIYSSLRLAHRMYVMINTIFENSNDNVKNYLKWLLGRNCYNPITCYFS